MLRSVYAHISGKPLRSTAPPPDLPETGLPDKPFHVYSRDEFLRRIEELTKIAKSGGANVFRDLRSLKALGQFHHPTRKFRHGRIRTRNTMSPGELADVLAHEVAHQIDSIISSGPRRFDNMAQGPATGDFVVLFGLGGPNDLFGLFNVKGQLAKDVIYDELVAVTRALVGLQVAESDPAYYYNGKELFARFLQSVMFHPNIIEAKAPHSYRQFVNQAVKHPQVMDYLNIAKGAVLDQPVTFMFMPDARQARIATYGNYLGTRIYGEEVIYRARRAKALQETKDLIKEHFKGVKDDAEVLFTAAEGVLHTVAGKPHFGTKIKESIALPQGWDINELHQALDDVNNGIRPMSPDKNLGRFYDDLAAIVAGDFQLVGIDGEGVAHFDKWRVTPQDAEIAYSSLSPEGQQLINDYTADIGEAKDLFNRERMKEYFGIDAEIEGYVHHFFEDKGLTQWRQFFLKERKASARKERGEVQGFVKDLKKATAKALSELHIEKEWNDFVSRQLALVAEPLEVGQNRPTKPGWMVIEGDLLHGLKMLGEDRTILLKEDGTSFLLKRGKKYQVPMEIYDTYIRHGAFGPDLTATQHAINSLNRYWQGNILLHTGTAATNLFSGALQLSAYMFDGFYRDILYGDAAMPRTRANVMGFFETLTPAGWKGAPDWAFGGDESLFYSEFFGQGKQRQGMFALADKPIDTLMIPYRNIERFFKKAILNAEKRKSGQADPLNDPELIKSINDVVDLFAYDYQNIPFWLLSLNRSQYGGLVKPFMTYPYKYAKMLTSMMGGAFDKNLPPKDRLAKVLAFATIVLVYNLIKRHFADPERVGGVQGYDSQTDNELKLKSVVNPRGRMYIGQDGEGNDTFVRTAKYPFLNFHDLIEAAIKGDIEAIGQMANDQLGTIGPLGKATLNQFGYSGEFDKFKTKETMHAETAASFIPLGRMLHDTAEFLDPKKRDLPNTPGLVFGQYVPTRDPDLAELLHGPEAAVKVPLRPDEVELLRRHNYGAAEDLVRMRLGEPAAKELHEIIEGHRAKKEGVGNTTVELTVPKQDMDVLAKMLGGIILKRVDREWYERFKIRAIENKAKREDKKKAAEAAKSATDED